MYKTKKEVDTHVRNALSKLRSENERHLRSFTIAKLYYKINEYSSAEQYLCSYLSVKEENDQAHKLLGQCYQRLKKPDKALQSFQRSLQLNPKQPDVLVEVCQLLLEDKNFNANMAKYWCDIAESEKVQHDAVFSLRLKVMNQDNMETNQVEGMIQKEISARPNDVQLRVRLLRNYLEQNQTLEAFRYVYSLEMSNNDSFANSSEWYNIVWLVLSKYEQLPNTKKDWEFWLLLAICLERQIYISFSLSAGSSNTGGVTETANLLFNFDQYLYKISQLMDKLSAQRELVTLFLDHYRGQLLLHAAALIFKRELLQNKNKWKETVKSVLPLLLLAFQTEVPANNKDPWMKHCDEQGKQLIQLWQREGAFRCAQAGRTLMSCIVDETNDKENAALQLNHMLGAQQTLWSNCDELLAQIRQTCSDKQWRRNVFALLFCNSDQKVKEQSSLLIKSPELAEPFYELPTYADVELYEESAQYLKPQSLSHMVYLCLANGNLAHVRAKYFSGLNFSTQNLSFCGAESLNQLDVESFLYAAAIQAKRMLEVDREAFDNYNSGNHSAAGKPRILPYVNLQAHLCSEEQAIWWTAAYQVYKNLSGDNLAEMRANLQFGIEAVRGINGPKIDMAIVFKLGQIFVARAQDIVKPVEKAYLEARAESIYKYGLNMLKMHNKGVLEPFRKYFKYAKSNTTAVERAVTTAAEEAVSYVASRFFKKAEYEDLIDEFAGVQLPFATYLQAEAYRKMDEANKTPKKAKRMYLDRASECLNQTLALLRSTDTDPNHPLNSVIQSEMKRVQSAAVRFSHDNCSPAVYHNNSSTYEDAEDNYYADHMQTTPGSAGAAVANARIRREVAAAALIASPHNAELENLVKQMATTLSFVKEEIIDNIKPELLSMRKEMTSLKDKISHLEETFKKTRISNPPSRDDASHVLDDLYMIEDALQNQMYQSQASTTSMMPAGAGPGMFANGATGSPFGPPQQQVQQRNAMQMQQNAAAVAAAAYNNPMFNPNFPMNYYTHPYVVQQQQQSQRTAANAAGAILGPHNLPLPFMDSTGLNIMPPNPALLAPPPPAPVPNQEAVGRQSSLYSLLAPQGNAPVTPQFPPLPAPLSLAPLMPSGTTNTPIANMGPAAIAAPAPAIPPPVNVQFNKAFNNQPVEKGPPANVVITNSDPLPNPNLSALQTPALSVTIPSHHIKSSLAQTPEASAQSQPVASSSGASFGGFGGFGGVGGGGLNATTSVAGGFSGTAIGTTNVTSSFTGIGTPTSSSGTSLFSSSSTFSNTGSGNYTANTAPPTISATTFSFKPQIEQAAQAMAANQSASGEQTLKNISGDSFASNKSVNVSASEMPDVEYDPRPDFKPIIPLPNEVEVKTGEEDEEVKFCSRAKLFRHADKEWKERGIGDMKILKNKETGASRILMRRDHTHKVCANHKITPELMLNFPQNEKKGVIWAAHDFADEELKLERFFLRFKLPETAQQFAEAFKQAQKEAREQESSAPATQAAAEKPKVAAAPFGLAKSNTMNFASSTPVTKGGSETNGSLLPAPKTTTTSNSESTATKSLFGGLNLATSKAEPAKTTTISPFANFTFDKTASSAGTTMSTSTPTVAMGIPSGTPSFGNLFGNLGKTPSPFSTANLPTFPPPTSSSALSGNSAPATTLNKSAASDNEEEYVPTAQFNPVIPLPDLVEVSTGEENELVLFEHRAKLLRYDKETGEWKERGIGNMKLLQDMQDKNKVRLVMRREQIHKLCCNQRLYKDTAFNNLKNSKTALVWAGQDYSENELVTETLAVRFKTAEVCKQFHDAILQAQSAMGNEAQEANVRQEEIKREQTPTTNGGAKPTEAPKGFGDAFKPKTGSWTCSDCYTSNGADKLYCAACEAPKDASVPKKETNSNALLSTTSKTTFSFGFKPATTATPVSAVATTTTATTVEQSNSTFKAPGFEHLFQKKTGAWNCTGCYLSNEPDDKYCKACEAPKDDTVPKKDAAPTTNNVLALSNPGQKFVFGFPAAGASSTAATTTPTTSSATPSFGFGAPKSGEVAKPAFGNSLANAATVDAATKPFSFTPAAPVAPLAKPTFSFTMQSKSTEKTTAVGGDGVESISPFSLDKKDFSFTMKPKSPGKAGKSPMKFGGGDADGGEDDDDYPEEEENNTYFTPVIALPDKIDVKTGEENEDLLYVHRAKLYRFSDGEWRERGLGDVKILRHRETKKLRVVMRRDQVLKICLNHVLNSEIEYKHKDDKSWLFVVNDFSEGAVELEKFSLRFKSKEIAQGFMDAIKSALAGTAVPIEASPAPLAEMQNISEADRAVADELSLPYEFFTAKPTCTGCRGCDPDKFVFTMPKSKEAFANAEDGQNPLKPLEMPQLSLPKQNRSLLKQSALATAVPPASTTLTPKGTDNVFSGFGSANSTGFGGTIGDKPSNASTFSFTAALNSTSNNDTKTGGMLFGSSSAVGGFGGGSIFGGGAKQPVFGQTPSIFGTSSKVNDSTKSSTDKSKSIFDGSGGSAFNTAAVSGGSIFNSQNIFSSGGSGSSPATNSNDATTKSLFGSNTTTQNTSGGSLFGNTTTFGTPKNNIFGSTANNSPANNALFGSASKDSTATAATPTFADLTNKPGVVDFASLAAKASTTPTSTAAATKEKPSGGFVGLTDQDAFSSFLKPNNSALNSSNLRDGNANDSYKSVEGGGDEAGEENYDPHYDPIIKMPDEIVVSTGEEEETKLFGERATLYRWDATSKEWKERGVGELKVLLHPANKTYRLILRREQIHKLVLNHGVGADFTFSNMNNSPKSFLWATLNYAESSEGQLEKLAVRFKNVDLADKFKTQLNECIEAAKQRPEQNTD